jgi:hypothetical protein
VPSAPIKFVADRETSFSLKGLYSSAVGSKNLVTVVVVRDDGGGAEDDRFFLAEVPGTNRPYVAALDEAA